MDYKTLIEVRKSVRDYKKTEISATLLAELTEYAGTCKHLVPEVEVEILVMAHHQVYHQLEDDAGYSGKMLEAPHYLLILSDKQEGYLENSGYVGESIVLKALDLEIGSCWITFPNSDILKQKLGLTGNKEVTAMIALGYPLSRKRVVHLPKIGQKYSSQVAVVENSTSSRMAIEEFVYAEKWGQAVDYDYLTNRGLVDSFYYTRLAPSTFNREPWRYIIDGADVILFIRNDQNTNLYEEQIDAGIQMLYFELITDRVLTDVTWTLASPDKDYGVPDDYRLVGYCRV